MLTLTSCDDDYYYDNGYDSYLVGTWELIQANGRPVRGYATNYLSFYSGGSGEYSYYENRVPYRMALRWSVSSWYDGAVLYITYADGSQVSMDYWYNSNGTLLYTSWYSGGYRNEYVYQLVDDFTWPMDSFARGSDTEEAITVLPGK